MADPPDTDENCELALDERMCGRVLRRLKKLEDQTSKAKKMKKKVKISIYDSIKKPLRHFSKSVSKVDSLLLKRLKL